MTRLKAQQRRKLQDKLHEVRCPGCRERALAWSTPHGAVLCGSCGAHSQPADHDLTWRSSGRTSYWTLATTELSS